MRDAFIEQMDYPKDLPLPYVVEGSKELFDRLAEGYYQGVTATAPGFYGPQGRTYDGATVQRFVYVTGDPSPAETHPRLENYLLYLRTHKTP